MSIFIFKVQREIIQIYLYYHLKLIILLALYFEIIYLKKYKYYIFQTLY
jgi:hypothetical protein